jgi:uncharacterized damage-inducible protein DinB
VCTYARGRALDASQLSALRAEEHAEDSGRTLDGVAFDACGAIDRALVQLTETPQEALIAPRSVGRASLPSTVIGLLVHVAEHTTRHVGQALTTAAILRGSREG